MAKYIIDVPEEQRHMYDEKEKVLSFLVTAKNATCNIAIDIDAEQYTEPDRKAIEDEVWELANYMGRMSLTERDLCFGFPLPQEVTMNLSYQEAKSKYEAWLEQKDAIKVGDEVGNGFVKGTAFFVDETMVEGFFIDEDEEIEHFWWNKRDCKKTGRHFPEVAELLEKMRGEEE